MATENGRYIAKERIIRRGVTYEMGAQIELTPAEARNLSDSVVPVKVPEPPQESPQEPPQQPSAPTRATGAKGAQKVDGAKASESSSPQQPPAAT